MFSGFISDEDMTAGIALISALYGLIILLSPFLISLFTRQGRGTKEIDESFDLSVTNLKQNPLNLQPNAGLTLKRAQITEAAVSYSPTWAYLLSILLTMIGICGQLSTALYLLINAGLDSVLPAALVWTLIWGLVPLIYVILFIHTLRTATTALRTQAYNDPPAVKLASALPETPLRDLPLIRERWSLM